ncbi:acetyltransferase [Burkholderiales bacterium JOSHI_001]|nr:acetyltransferase [Burkholderiales bacterium JOSHI_001]
MAPFHVTAHDAPSPEECAAIDEGLGASNNTAAPLHEVNPIACFARRDDGTLLGGAVGRRWGTCAELQQLWVHPEHRRNGIGTALVQGFQSFAESKGCSALFLETFSFQAPGLYLSLGFSKVSELAIYPHGIVKYILVKYLGGSKSAA